MPGLVWLGCLRGYCQLIELDPVGLVCGCAAIAFAWWWLFMYGEFDPGSGRTLAACLTHASRTMKLQLAVVD